MASKRPGSACRSPHSHVNVHQSSSPCSKHYLSPISNAKTPGIESWNIEAFLPEEPDIPALRTPMKSRKGKSQPPTWLINTVAPPKIDANAAHMRAHVQSLARLEKEELAESLFHTKLALTEQQEINKLSQVENRRLEAIIARTESNPAGTLSSMRTRSHSPGSNRNSPQPDIVRNLKAKNKQLRGAAEITSTSPEQLISFMKSGIAKEQVERNKALQMVAHLQRGSRVARLAELQTQVGVLRDEVANQMALRKGAAEELRRAVVGKHGPSEPLRGVLRPASSPPSLSGKRKLTEVLQELLNASKPLKGEALRLRDACCGVTSEEFKSSPQYRAAGKVHSLLLDHIVTMIDHLTSMPCSELLASALQERGVLEMWRNDRQSCDDQNPPSLMTQKLPQEQGLSESILALAGPFASLVVKMYRQIITDYLVHEIEGLTTQEYESDSSVREATSNLELLVERYTVALQKFKSQAQLVQESRSLQASLVNECPGFHGLLSSAQIPTKVAQNSSPMPHAEMSFQNSTSEPRHQFFTSVHQDIGEDVAVQELKDSKMSESEQQEVLLVDDRKNSSGHERKTSEVRVRIISPQDGNAHSQLKSSLSHMASGLAKSALETALLECKESDGQRNAQGSLREERIHGVAITENRKPRSTDSSNLSDSSSLHTQTSVSSSSKGSLEALDQSQSSILKKAASCVVNAALTQAVHEHQKDSTTGQGQSHFTRCEKSLTSDHHRCSSIAEACSDDEINVTPRHMLDSSHGLSDSIKRLLQYTSIEDEAKEVGEGDEEIPQASQLTPVAAVEVVSDSPALVMHPSFTPVTDVVEESIAALSKCPIAERGLTQMEEMPARQSTSKSLMSDDLRAIDSTLERLVLTTEAENASVTGELRAESLPESIAFQEEQVVGSEQDLCASTVNDDDDLIKCSTSNGGGNQEVTPSQVTDDHPGGDLSCSSNYPRTEQSDTEADQQETGESLGIGANHLKLGHASCKTRDINSAVSDPDAQQLTEFRRSTKGSEGSSVAEAVLTQLVDEIAEDVSD